MVEVAKYGTPSRDYRLELLTLQSLLEMTKSYYFFCSFNTSSAISANL